MKPVVDKFIALLLKKGIKFESTDGENENVIFSFNDKTTKISYHSFYRFSGITCFIKFLDDNTVEIIRITDEMYLMTFIKPIIEKRLLED